MQDLIPSLLTVYRTKSMSQQMGSYNGADCVLEGEKVQCIVIYCKQLMLNSILLRVRTIPRFLMAVLSTVPLIGVVLAFVIVTREKWEGCVLKWDVVSNKTSKVF